MSKERILQMKAKRVTVINIHDSSESEIGLTRTNTVDETTEELSGEKVVIRERDGVTRVSKLKDETEIFQVNIAKKIRKKRRKDNEKRKRKD